MAAVRTIKLLWREPLIQFGAAGTLLFLAHAYWGSSPATEVIVVTPGTIQTLVAEREALLLRPIREDERRELVSDFIDEEILLREAYRAGFDRSDPRIRRWLIDKMQFLLDEEPAEPTRAELEARFRKNPERYATPLAVSFDHVFYSTGAEVPEAPDGILKRLRAGADFGKLGEPFWLGPTLRRFSHRELSGTLGSEFADRLASLPPGEWNGPISSSRGTHWVRVLSKHEPQLPAFDDVAWAVRADFLGESREVSLEGKLTDLRSRYRVEVQGDPGKP